MTEAFDTSTHDEITLKGGSRKVHAEKKNLKDLGNFAKEIGLKKNLDTAEIKGVNYIKPNHSGIGWVAKSRDYVVIMHFNKNLGVYGQKIKEENIEKAYHQYQFDNFKKNNTIQSNHFPSQVENIKPEMTFKEKSKNGLDYSSFNKQPNANIELGLRKLGTVNGVSSLHPIRGQGEKKEEFIGYRDLSPRNLAVRKEKSKEHTRFVENTKTGGTGALATQPQVTEVHSDQSEQFEVESEGQTRAKQDEIFN